MMSTGEHLLPLEENTEVPWRTYVLDSVLAIVGTLLVTGIIFLWQLYPRIPNISIVYLLVVIGLASTRGRYASILAAVVAFLSFDFFIVPPIYTFVIYRLEEWIALFVFLIDAIVTSQLAVALRERASQASRREHETRILYDLMRVTSGEEEPARQLQAIARAIVDVFSSWGVHDCAILQPDAAGRLQVQASAYQPVEHVVLSSDEQAMAGQVTALGHSMSLYDDTALPSASSTYGIQRVMVRHAVKGRAVAHILRLLPLKMGPRIVGVLRLRVLTAAQHVREDERLQEDQEPPNARTTFFWTFLDQASALIEHARLRQENLRIDILQRTDALRAALLSSVSHDLRTPLTAIKAAASSLLQEDVQWDDEARRGFARSIVRQADRLNRLVGNLLDMSRIEEGALQPEKEWYHLAELVYDVLERLKPQLQGRLMHTHLPSDLPPIEVDYLQMDQVLTNLLENALRYTPAGSSIDIDVEQHEEQLVLSVADRGPGIPPEDVERIFDKFYRVLDRRDVPGPVSGTPPGSGLGLAVCRGLVEAHGGRIWVEPRPGGGAIFLVALPRRASERVVA